MLHGLQEVTQLHDRAALLSQQLQQTQAGAAFGLQDLERALLQVETTANDRFKSGQHLYFSAICLLYIWPHRGCCRE